MLHGRFEKGAFGRGEKKAVHSSASKAASFVRKREKLRRRCDSTAPAVRAEKKTQYCWKSRPSSGDLELKAGEARVGRRWRLAPGWEGGAEEPSGPDPSCHCARGPVRGWVRVPLPTAHGEVPLPNAHGEVPLLTARSRCPPRGPAAHGQELEVSIAAALLPAAHGACAPDSLAAAAVRKPTCYVCSNSK